MNRKAFSSMIWLICIALLPWIFLGGLAWGEPLYISHLRSIYGDARAPVRVAVDLNGDLYVSDTTAGQVLIFTPSGEIKGAVTGLQHPLGIAIGADGLLYIGESGRRAISVYNRAGEQVGSLGAGQLQMPNDIALDRQGNLWVVDSQDLAHAVKQFSPQGELLNRFGPQGGSSGYFRFAVGIAYDPVNNRLLVTDQRNNRIQAFSTSGQWLATFSGDARIEGIAVDSLGRIYLADAYQGRVKVLDAAGNCVRDAAGACLYAGGFGQEAGRLLTPSDVTIDPSGRLIVTSTNTSRIEVFALLNAPPPPPPPPLEPPQVTPLPAGTVLTPFGKLRWKASPGGPTRPTYVLEFTNSRGVTQTLRISDGSTSLSLHQLGQSVALVDGETYRWRIKVIDDQGGESPWAEGGKFLFNEIFVRVDSVPLGASIFAAANPGYEGEYLDVTRSSVSVPDILFSLRLSLPGYEEGHFPVDARNGQDQELSAGLKSGLSLAFTQEEAVTLNAGEGIHAPSPFVVDWDDDGTPNLLLGTAEGKVLRYATTSPEGGETTLGEGLSLEYQGEEQLGAGSVVPFVVDWDGDWKKDLLVGDSEGHLYLYRNQGSDASPLFLKREEVTTVSGNLLASGGLAPSMADWDGDGLPDLLVGNGDGTIRWVRNVGEPSQPAFEDSSSPILVGEAVLNVGGKTRPWVTDLDQDGRKDLIVGAADGTVRLLLNTASAPGEPRFSSSTVLWSGAGSDAAPALAEWDSRPGRDLIVGSGTGAVWKVSGEVTGFVSTYLELLISRLEGLNRSIQALPDENFAGPPRGHKTALANKIDEVIVKVRGSELQEAWNKLNNDLRAKFDGSAGGNPENDWIINTESSPGVQADLMNQVDGLVAEMQEAVREAGLDRKER